MPYRPRAQRPWAAFLSLGRRTDGSRGAGGYSDDPLEVFANNEEGLEAGALEVVLEDVTGHVE